jgi:hypothetical protein
MLPKLPWFVAATSQLVSNSVSRVLPGGAAIGGAVLYRMLSVSGVTIAQATSAMAASTIVSYALLFGIPAIAGLAALAGAPVPDGMAPAVFAGGAAFAALVAVSVAMIVFGAPVRLLGRCAARAVPLAGRLVGREWAFTADELVAERARMIAVLGPRWPKAVAAATGNWAFDYLALLCVLYAVGADPSLGMVLLAFAVASVLAIVPLTPGGVGFVEVGLYSALVVSGIGSADAAVATLAYRVVSWWLPVVAGALAWFAFRARYPGATRGTTLSRHPGSQGPISATPDGPPPRGLLPSPSCERTSQLIYRPTERHTGQLKEKALAT